jgi:lycopene beta-cyclase
MRTTEYDAVIAGGGLSGLSLAAHLAAGAWRDRSVLLVDDSAADPAAQAWGSWSAGTGLLDAAVSRTYRHVRIHAGAGSRVVALDPYRYRVVHRDDLRRVAMRIIDQAPRFTAVSGRVEHVRDAGDTAELTVDGQRVRTQWAFDSTGRATPPPSGAPDARLAFTGWRVRSHRPVFNPSLPTLFDFRTPQGDGARFAYVLPSGHDDALVELTEFVPRHADPPPAAEREAALRDYLSRVVRCDDYEVVRTESAVIPLYVRPAPRCWGHVIRIGARAGLIKATTGYAYQRIQRDSARIARSLSRYGHPCAIPPGRERHRLLDDVLLDVFDRDPPQLERAFARLFAANPARRVLRFLDEETRLHEELLLMASMPPLPYLRALAARAY